MQGPKAPKDPEKQRAYFYIMRNKEIFASPSADGRGIQYIYENDGRLINSAQIVGNITDKDMLELLKTTDGFKKLVHSIGVSVEAPDNDDTLEFIFQMYGKNDTYGGGTKLGADIKCDGMEKRIILNDIEWSSDDKEPGQIRFEFDEPEKLAKVSVRFYLNDGYNAPDVEEEIKIETDSDDYKKMIENSLMRLGDTRRIERVLDDARSGKKVTLAYIGGSITQGAGATPINTECYACKSWQLFKNKYGADAEFIKAGVGGTPSELGMIRFERDVLRDGKCSPDIIVIEFAVNDEGDETKGVCYESLVRKALALPNKPAVILLFSVFASDWNLQERLSPVGERYNLPMVSILNAVVWQFRKTVGEGRVLSKNQFFYDMFHPSNIGHTIMADALMYLIDKADKNDSQSEIIKTPDISSDVEPVIGDDFTHVKLLDKKDKYDRCVINEGGFTECDIVLQCVEMDDNINATPQFSYNWMYDGSKSPKNTSFELKINAKAILLVFKDSGETDAARADVFVDGKKVFVADPHENGWTHCNAKIIYQGTQSSEHMVCIKIAEGDEKKKFTILGFGYVE